MKLLFDQNLSPRLPQLLADLFPGSLHVREVGMTAAEDSMLWEFAKTHDLVIVSKDSDFQQRSLLHGSPPKFIWLRLGNCSVTESAELLRRYSAAIYTFELEENKTHLMLP